MEYYTDKQIGQIIKRHRIYWDMTQGELGEKLGVQAAAVQKWESGLVKNIKRSILRELSNVLKINPATLIGFPTEYQYEKIYESGLTGKERKQIEEFIKSLIDKRK